MSGTRISSVTTLPFLAQSKISTVAWNDFVPAFGRKLGTLLFLVLDGYSTSDDVCSLLMDVCDSAVTRHLPYFRNSIFASDEARISSIAACLFVQIQCVGHALEYVHRQILTVMRDDELAHYISLRSTLLVVFQHLTEKKIMVDVMCLYCRVSVLITFIFWHTPLTICCFR